MVGWDAREAGGVATVDPRVQRYPLGRVLEETDRLLSGTHPSTRARLRLLDAVAGVLAL